VSERWHLPVIGYGSNSTGTICYVFVVKDQNKSNQRSLSLSPLQPSSTKTLLAKEQRNRP